MSARKALLPLSDAFGLGRLAADAALGVSGLVEEMHTSILNTPVPWGTLGRGPTAEVTRLVYRGVRGAFRLTGAGIGAASALLGDTRPDGPTSRGREVALAALNGLCGDHLVETDNPLALPMRLRHAGAALRLDGRSLAAALPDATGKLVVLAHGLGMSDLQWRRRNHDHGAALARECRYTPVYLSYNSGAHVSLNGRAFAAMLESLVAEWPAPIEDFVIVGHSMGGLVARSACHYGEAAGHAWRRRLRKMVFLGTPHHGAPLERIGAWADLALGKAPYVAAFNRLGRVRSAGVTDLRYGNLVDEDWLDRDRFARGPDPRRAIALPEDVACYAIAATTARTAGGAKDRLIGDGLVPVGSALGRHEDPARALAFAADRQWIATAAGHLDLLSRRDVFDRIAGWVSPTE